MSALTMECPCEAVKRRDEWHRRRGSEACVDALEARRDAERAKYAQKRAKDGQSVVRPWVRNADGSRWVPGSEIVLPEVDPL